LAYYLGKTISSFYRIVLASLHFSGIYYVLAIPVTSFLGYFWLFTLMYFGVYGMSTCVAMLVRRENAALLATVVALFASGKYLVISSFSNCWLWYHSEKGAVIRYLLSLDNSIQHVGS